MGFLRRLVGGSSSTVQLQLHSTYFTRIRDDAAVEVVGEQYRQGNVLGARPPGPNDLPPGLPPPPAGFYKALLLPEPTNQYDANAIMVLAWAGGNWANCGYLSRGDAASYQPLFQHLARQQPNMRVGVACDAAKVNERGGVGLVLHLGSPGECIAELVTDDVQPPGDSSPWPGRTVAFTGQGETAIHGVPVDRQAQVMLAQWAGCTVLPRVTKKVEALIAASRQDMTGNLQKAKDYGIPVVSEAAFLVEIGVPSEAVSGVTGRWARG